MLSICIPIFNFDMRPLVSELHRQCVLAAIDFEIQLLDDASAIPVLENASLQQLHNVVYAELPQNQGRARIRNMLAQKANGDYLLFMDCDSAIVSGDYIAKYIVAIKEGHAIICGGRCYLPQPPSDKAKYLRWKYGVERESGPAAERSLYPHKSFLTCNFAIQKKAMLENPFNHELVRYGHEDTLFGFQLQQKNIAIHHIDNPLAHIGLEDAAEFLQKSEEAVENLLFICSTMPALQKQFTSEVKLLRTYRKLQQLDPLTITRSMISRTMPLMRKNLLGPAPDLRWFDMYRLGLLYKKSLRAQRNMPGNADAAKHPGWATAED